MLIQELFDKKVDYQVIDANKDYFSTEAHLGGRKIRFAADYLEEDATWEITFSEILDGKTTFKLSGSGHEFEVATMVKSSMKEFIDRYHPESFIFSSDDRRINVYKKILGLSKLNYKEVPFNVEYIKYERK